MLGSVGAQVAIGHVRGRVSELVTVPTKSDRCQSADRQTAEIFALLYLRRRAIDAGALEMADLQIRTGSIQISHKRSLRQLEREREKERKKVKVQRKIKKNS